jgi:hypothetical protein
LRALRAAAAASRLSLRSVLSSRCIASSCSERHTKRY